MFIAIKQDKYRFFWLGLIAVIVQFIAMIILGRGFEGDMPLLLGTIVLSIILMVIQFKKSPS